MTAPPAYFSYVADVSPGAFQLHDTAEQALGRALEHLERTNEPGLAGADWIEITWGSIAERATPDALPFPGTARILRSLQSVGLPEAPAPMRMAFGAAQSLATLLWNSVQSSGKLPEGFVRSVGVHVVYERGDGTQDIVGAYAAPVLHRRVLMPVLADLSNRFASRFASQYARSPTDGDGEPN